MTKQSFAALKTVVENAKNNGSAYAETALAELSALTGSVLCFEQEPRPTPGRPRFQVITEKKGGRNGF